MHELLDELVRATGRCESAAKKFEAKKIRAICSRLGTAIDAIGRAWSGSWIGYQARIYTVDFHPRRPGEHFDSDWGTSGGLANRTRGEWVEYSHDAVTEHVMKLARVSDTDWACVARSGSDALAVFEATKTEVISSLDAILAEHDDDSVRNAREEIASTPTHIAAEDFFRALAQGRHASNDRRALNEGIQVAPHLQIRLRLSEQLSYGTQISTLSKQIRQITTYLQKRHRMTTKTAARTDGKIFIGHGRSAVWRDLKDFIQDRLHLPWEEFNREPTAGKSTKERLEEMLDASSFALLVMTGQDGAADGKTRARANVIHEVGLFQGRLGFERAIVLLEQGCEEFSNITGITQIRFPQGNVRAQFEEVRQVLEREGILHK